MSRVLLSYDNALGDSLTFVLIFITFKTRLSIISEIENESLKERVHYLTAIAVSLNFDSSSSCLYVEAYRLEIADQ